MNDKTVHERRWGILGVLIVSLLIVVLDNSVLNVALKVLAEPRPRGIAASQSNLEWAINSYTLVFAGMLLTWGVLGDRVGRRRILLLGFVLFGIASLASAYSQGPLQLIAARALMGLGGAAVMPATLAIISNVFEPAERPKAIGLWAGAVGIGIAIGPIVGGALLAHFWWGSVFLINVPIVVVGGLLIALVVPESRNPRPAKLDPVGVVLEVVGLVLVVYAIIKVGDVGTVLAVSVLAPFVAGALVLAMFVRYERRIEHPTLDIALFRDPRFSAAVGSIALVFFGLMGVTFFMVFYLQSARGYTPLQSGVRLLPLAVAQLIASSRSAGLVARFGPKAVCTAGLLVMTAAFGGFLLLGVHSSVWLLEVLFFLQGIAIGNVMPPATESIMASLPREKAGAGSAVNNVARQVGGALGIAVLGSVLAGSYRHQLAPALNATAISEHLRQAMEKSIEATQSIAGQAHLPASVLVKADTSFVHAMHITALCAGGAGLLGALVAFSFLPGRRPAGTVLVDAVQREVAPRDALPLEPEMIADAG
jgi:EmrB/QacA subfamily drug resistance transporter